MSDNQMYCYVCYHEYSYEVEPDEVFWYEKDAKEWCKKNINRVYKKMSIS